MPTILKATMFFGSDSGKGWSESHHLSVGTPPGDLLQYLSPFKSLADNYRRPLLGSDCYLKGLRISYETDSGAIASSPFRYTPFSYPSNKNDGAAPNVSAKARMGDATNTKFSDIHLRGFWDAVEANEQLDFTTAKGAQWKQLLDQFTAALVNGGYGFLAIDDFTTYRGKITGYTTDADGFITFTLELLDGPAMPPAGTKVDFRAAKLNGSKSILNRTMVCEVVDDTHVKTVVPTAAGDFVSKGTYVIRGTSFSPYTGVQYTILGRRSMGRPTLQSPTRQRAAPRN